MQSIIEVIDTGACEDSIVKDITEFSEEDVRKCIKNMLAQNLLIDRKAYLVFNYRSDSAKSIVYGDTK